MPTVGAPPGGGGGAGGTNANGGQGGTGPGGTTDGGTAGASGGGPSSQSVRYVRTAAGVRNLQVAESQRYRIVGGHARLVPARP